MMRLMTVLWCVAGAQCLAQGPHSFRANTPDGSGLELRLSPWLASQPPLGYVPVLVTVENQTGARGMWNVGATTGLFSGAMSNSMMLVEVPGGGSASVTFLAAASYVPDDRSRSWRSLNFTVSGPRVALPNAGQVNACQIEPRYGGSYVGLGLNAQKAFDWVSRSIDQATARTANGVPGSKVSVEFTPVDWRGLTGLSGYWMTEGEWRGLRGPQKTAVLEWAALGGQVVVALPEGGEAEEVLRQTLPAGPFTGGRAQVGLGGVRAMVVKEPLPEGNTRSELLEQQEARSVASLLKDFGSSSWKAKRLVPAPQMQMMLMGVFLVVFAVLVGPVNLFVFAGPSRRQRLFWTTPLLSVGGSVALLLIMILSDGTGGQGVRMSVGVMVPELDRMVVRQEQVCRTGVLLGAAFPVAEPSVMTQLVMKRGGSPLLSTGEQMVLNEDGTQRSGDWFRSRSVQAHALQTVRASRGEVRFRSGGEKPSVVSSLEVPLARVWVVDESGTTWTAGDVAPGERKGLERSAVSFEKVKWGENELPSLAGPLLKDALAEVQKLKGGYVMAEVARGAASRLAISTLDSIRWNEDAAFIVGPYVTDEL